MSAETDLLDFVTSLGSRIINNTAGLKGQVVYFTGSYPYLPGDLAAILPPGIQSADLEDGAPNSYTSPRTAYLILGGADFDEAEIQRYMEEMPSEAAFLPQEGFIDLILFGNDWWKGRVPMDDETLLLDAFLDHHGGLQFAKSLEAGQKFVWPSTVQSETSGHSTDEFDYSTTTALFDSGYRISGLSRSARRRVLGATSIPALGLQEVVQTIASLVRTRKSQVGGRDRYRNAIREWEADLNWLKANHYHPARDSFRWPATEPHPLSN